MLHSLSNILTNGILHCTCTYSHINILKSTPTQEFGSKGPEARRWPIYRSTYVGTWHLRPTILTKYLCTCPLPPFGTKLSAPSRLNIPSLIYSVHSKAPTLVLCTYSIRILGLTCHTLLTTSLTTPWLSVAYLPYNWFLSAGAFFAICV